MQLPDKDNEFDDLIRAAGENYQAPGTNPDWDNMQALLDKEMPVKKGPHRKFFFFLLTVLILLLSGGTYLYLNKTTDKKSVLTSREQQPLEQTTSPASSQPVSPVIKEDEGQVIAKTADPANALANQKLAAPLSSTTGNPVDVVIGNTAQNGKSPLLTDKKILPEQQQIRAQKHARLKNKTAGKLNVNTAAGELGENNQPVNQGDDGTTSEIQETIVPTTKSTAELSPKNKNTDTVESNNVIQKTGTVATENKVKPDSTNIAGSKKAKPGNKRKSTFEFSLLYAPELTTIGFSHLDKPGSNYGLLIGYHISDKLIIQTGVIRSKKNYIADGSDFVLRRPLAPYNKLNKVGGYCMMYEIPLNIKSQILSRKKFNLFYTAGVSSYIMKGEYYTYYYSTPYGDSSRSAKFDTQNNYWFALATAGIGLEKNIGKDLDIGIMPFIKIPFKGMGRGSLKLMGTGVNFTLTYKPSFSKK
ncbi:MAG: hypothetical protein ABIQ31_09045 [Ferruginibacter sp.]